MLLFEKTKFDGTLLTMMMTRRKSLTIVTILLLWATSLQASDGRPKDKDGRGEELIPFELIGEGCEDAEYDYAIVDNNLEQCKQLSELDGTVSQEYEQRKCSQLRISSNAEIVDGKCQCKKNYTGAMCQYWNGPFSCPSKKHSYVNGVCTSNMCRHNGMLAIGSKEIECSCPLPWDGRWCERLACWRMADEHSMESHWKNNVDRCDCREGYEGSNCEYVNKCEEGTLDDGTCYCHANYTGDFCDRRCGPGTSVVCGATPMQPFVLLLAILALITSTHLGSLFRKC